MAADGSDEVEGRAGWFWEQRAYPFGSIRPGAHGSPAACGADHVYTLLDGRVAAVS